MNVQELISMLKEVLPLIILTAFLIIYFTSISKFKEESITYEKIKELNEKYNFNSINPGFTIYQRYDSLRQLMHSNFDKDIYIYSKNDDYNLSTIMSSILFNRMNVENYNDEFNSIMDDFDTNEAKLSVFQRMFGKRLCLSKRQKPKLDTKITIKGMYTSPKGRKSYDAEETYNYDKITSICMRYDELEELRRGSLDERAKMSDSLRYDVLKRDGFKCKICGATANDGVKLHVDHIIPVSKGGKTEMSNLQTLCERCNMGKSNKM